MSWYVNISGHYGEGSVEDQKAKEEKVIEVFRNAAKELEATMATASFQHHGPVNLLDDNG